MVRRPGSVVLALLVACGPDTGAPPPIAAPSAAVAPTRDPLPVPPEGSQEMRIHWKLKLPELHGRDGDHVVRDREGFRSLLSECGERDFSRWERWNSIEWRRQMAIVAVRTFSCGGSTISIDSVWRTETEIVVFLRCTGSWGEPVTQAVEFWTVGVVVNRCDLPVRFVSFVSDEAG